MHGVQLPASCLLREGAAAAEEAVTRRQLRRKSAARPPPAKHEVDHGLITCKRATALAAVKSGGRHQADTVANGVAPRGGTRRTFPADLPPVSSSSQPEMYTPPSE